MVAVVAHAGSQICGVAEQTIGDLAPATCPSCGQVAQSCLVHVLTYAVF